MTTTCSLQHRLLLVILLLNLWPCFRSAINITHLPGYSDVLPFRLETGYVSMDDKRRAELFYYFVESEGNPSEDPLILWLVGGPGCSAISSLVLEMGPIRFNTDDFHGNFPSIILNPYAWTKIASMIFVDWPIGTGFSYSRTDNNYVTDDWQEKKLIYEFLKKWLVDHPLFLSNTFYMGGDSYGGKMATLVANEIVQGNEEGQQPVVNIKGYLIGNPVTGEKVDINTEVSHAYGLGIVPRELNQAVENDCVGEDFENPTNALCAAHLKVYEDFNSEINTFSILDPKCDEKPPNPEEIVGSRRSLMENYNEFLNEPSDPDISCLTGDLITSYWANNPLVREALQIKEGSIGRWNRCSLDVSKYHYEQNIPTTVPYHFNLTTRGYQALVYSGDHDLKIPFTGSLKWIKSLGFSVLDPWRSWHVNGQVAGYTVLFSNNMTFATVKGGNHVAPSNRPLQCFSMFKKWISHEVL